MKPSAGEKKGRNPKQGPLFCVVVYPPIVKSEGSDNSREGAGQRCVADNRMSPVTRNPTHRSKALGLYLRRQNLIVFRS